MIDSVSNSGDAPDMRCAKRTRQPQSATVDRLPPHALDMEQGVLGCILISPNDCMGECAEKIGGTPDAFYDLRHQTIFFELVRMYDDREPIDVITLQQKLKDKQLLEDAGGFAYLSSLPDVVPSAANLSYYLGVVQEKFLLRKMINACTTAVGSIYDHEGDVNQIMDEVERDVLAVRSLRTERQTKPIKELVKDAINTIEDFHQRQGATTGIATGFADFDRMTSGMNPGEMLVIAARPSMGKTSLAMNIAEHVSMDLKLPVGVFSLEMTAEALVLRILCSRSRVNLRNIRDGFLAERDFPKLTGTSGKLAIAPLYIDDESGLSILKLRAKARRMAQQYGIKLFVIDYLQLLHTTNRKCKSRQEEITDISNGVKSLAKELRVPVLVLSQLNRELEKDKNRRPRMSDLRESGSIEQDADLVGLLYKPTSKDDEPQEESDAMPVNLLVAKQRNGPTGDVHLTFLKSFTRFESAAKISDNDIE